MKEINIARAIVNKRREKGLTQDDLANYIGVSKASVSKWETGQNYPDITFLPQLAAFSISALMNLWAMNRKWGERISVNCICGYLPILLPSHSMKYWKIAV